MGAERLLLLLVSALSVGAAPSQPHAADISAASAVAFAPVPPEIGTGATWLRWSGNDTPKRITLGNFELHDGYASDNFSLTIASHRATHADLSVPIAA